MDISTFAVKNINAIDRLITFDVKVRCVIRLFIATLVEFSLPSESPILAGRNCADFGLRPRCHTCSRLAPELPVFLYQF
jgi:hypothetical protein